MPIGIFKCNERLFIRCGKQPFSLIQIRPKVLGGYYHAKSTPKQTKQKR